MTTHSRILAWKTLWTDKPGGLQSMGSQSVGHDCSNEARHTAHAIACLDFLKNKFIYLLLAMLGLCCCLGFSLVVETRSYSLVAACGPLFVGASLTAEHHL